MDDVILRLGIECLVRAGAERVGPCPICGGTDRFAVNVRSHLALCRRCGLRAGDQVGLVQAVLGMKFPEALKWLMGVSDATVSDAEIQRRRERARESREQNAREAEAYRQRSIRDAERIWRAAEPPTSPILRAYLIGRGFHPNIVNALPKTIRFIGAHRYVRKVAGTFEVLHEGPAMIARIATPELGVSAVHQTWIDPARPGKKAAITRLSEHNKGRPWPSKLVRGSAKGGVIALNTARSGPIVMGEGIETTLTAMARDAVPGAAYWAGVSLGNMGEPMQRVPGQRWSGIPDMSDERAFVPPEWCTRLILIQDGDSNPKQTRAILESGARRAMARVPGLRAQIVHPGAGVDLNDLIKPKDPEGSDE